MTSGKARAQWRAGPDGNGHAVKRQAHRRCGEPIRLRSDLNGAAVGADNPPGDTEAQPAAFDGLAVAGITAEKGVENAWQDFRRDARAGVGDGQLRRIRPPAANSG